MKKWKTSPNEELEKFTFGLGASCSKLETLIYIEVIARSGGVLKSAPRVNLSKTHHCVIVTQ